MLHDLVSSVVAFVREHQSWAPAVAFVVAFGESICFASLIWPGWAMLIGIATLLAAGGSDLSVMLPLVVGAGLGGTLGYAVSYWFGLYFKDSMANIWPFTRYPDMIPQGRQFFEQYGAMEVFLGHFFGPVRAVIPVVAGMYAMRQLPFQIANVASAFIWAVAVVVPAFLAVTFRDDLMAFMRDHELLVAAALFAIALLNAFPHHIVMVPTLLAFVVLGAGHLYAGGSVWPLLIAGTAGAFAGDHLAYRIGEQNGDRIAEVRWLGVNLKRLGPIRALLVRHGWFSLIWSKFAGMRRAFVPLVAGMQHMNKPVFAAVSVAASLLWAGVLLAPYYVLRLVGW